MKTRLLKITASHRLFTAKLSPKNHTGKPQKEPPML